MSGVRAAEHRRTLMFLVRGVACAEEVLLVDVVWQFEEDVAAHLAQLDDIVARPRLDRVEVEPRSAGAARVCPDIWGSNASTADLGGVLRLEPGTLQMRYHSSKSKCGMYPGAAWSSQGIGASRWTKQQMCPACMVTAAERICRSGCMARRHQGAGEDRGKGKRQHGWWRGCG